MGEMRQAVQDVKRALNQLAQEMPEAMQGFSRFMEAVARPGVLDVKTKELIALATALTARCKYCIGIHTEEAFNAGATEEELWEVATVAVMMGGGPALTHVAELSKAIAEFKPSSTA